MVKCWYVVTKKQGEGGLFSLFYADSLVAVEARMNELGQTGKAAPLSERGLAELVGHYPNETHEVSDLAIGPIMLNYAGRIITIHG